MKQVFYLNQTPVSDKSTVSGTFSEPLKANSENRSIWLLSYSRLQNMGLHKITSLCAKKNRLVCIITGTKWCYGFKAHLNAFLQILECYSLSVDVDGFNLLAYSVFELFDCAGCICVHFVLQ
jgi:hypothetical protein